MSNPTSNFGWQMPTPTDLVTSLPADFEVFGQAVDSTMADLKGGTSGQILSKNSNTDMDFVWITNDQGDITAVNVTSPITGGGTSGAVTVGIQSATTSQSGAVQLSDSTSTTSSVLAATPTAVKSAYDLAASAYAPAFTNNFYAGKNKITNGNFGIWQRGTTINMTSGVTAFYADRFQGRGDAPSGTPVVTRQTFTPGTAPVSGYEGQYFLRYTTGGNVTMSIGQTIEDVRTLAGQTITVSFWAKSSTAKTFTILVRQAFGTGGSGDVDQSFNYTTTTSWQRFTQTLTLGSLSGKTIGTNSYLLLQPLSYSAQTGNFDYDIWGVQVEAGSVATPFSLAGGGDLQNELAMCQRFFQTITPVTSFQDVLVGSASDSTAYYRYSYVFPVQMRVAPTLSTPRSTGDYCNLASGGLYTSSSLPTLESSRTSGCSIAVYSGGVTKGFSATFRNGATGYTENWLNLSAEF